MKSSITNSIFAIGVMVILSACSSNPNTNSIKTVAECHICSIHSNNGYITLTDDELDKIFYREQMKNFEDKINNEQISIDEYLELLKKGCELYKVVLSKSFWSRKEYETFKEQNLAYKRNYLGYKFEKELRTLRIAFMNAKRHNIKIDICKKGIESIKKELKNDIWTIQEKKSLNNDLVELKTEINEIEREFNALLINAKKDLKGTRVNFVNKNAKRDLRTANSIFNRNNGKWVNWWGIRNNMVNMRKGWSLCEGIKRSPYSKYHYRTQAANIQNKMRGMMTGSQVSSCQRHPVQRMRDRRGFPKWNPQNKAESDFMKQNEKINIEKLNIENIKSNKVDLAILR